MGPFSQFGRFGARGRAWLRANARLTVAAAALLVLFGVVDFSPPPRVRVGDETGGEVVGDAPRSEFAGALSNPQAVQIRATLRLWDDPGLDVSRPDPEIDEVARVLSQPVVTTVFGLDASVDQTVRLGDGDLEVEVGLRATPRLNDARARKAGNIQLDHELIVRSRAHGLLRPVRERVHVDTRGVLAHVERDGHRMVFSVDDHLFALDLELSAPGVDATLARGR